MSFWIKYESLSQQQVQIINDIINSRLAENVGFIKGFAGTGKTLVLLHVLEKISVLEPYATISFITFTNSLIDLISTSPVFNNSKRAKLKLSTYDMFLKHNIPYDYVLIDEVQDIPFRTLQKIKKLAKHIIIAGDHDQQIYDTGATIDEIKYVFPNIIERNLIEVFRITKNICKLAHCICPEINIVEGLLSARKNSTINIAEADSIDDEFFFTIETAISRALPGQPSIIIFWRHIDIENFGKILQNYVSEKYRINNPPTLKRIKEEK
ncbi:MAG: AAA family ATPase, partial [Clostridiales Family XIII bacterium]|nr:AAA family ATPase [Clostridiales Family XIII bacterium]